MAGLTLIFEAERETKGTYRFQERVDGGELEEPKVGTLYVKKATLRAMEWTPGQPITVTLQA